MDPLMNVSTVATRFSGGKVDIITTNPRHFTADMKTVAADKAPTPNGSFVSMLGDALSTVNDKQQEADRLTELMITNPEKVELHDVMIAMEEAKLALNLTRTIRDTAIKAYREITNLR